VFSPAIRGDSPEKAQRYTVPPRTRAETNGSGTKRAADSALRAAGANVDAGTIAAKLLENVERVVRGKRREVSMVVASMASGGHVLIEDVPGTAKTVLARAIAQSIKGATVGMARSGSSGRRRRASRRRAA
jgi:hypothetical protein